MLIGKAGVGGEWELEVSKGLGEREECAAGRKAEKETSGLRFLERRR